MIGVLIFLCVGGLLVAMFWWGARDEPGDAAAGSFNPITGTGGVPMTDPDRGIEGPDDDDVARFGQPAETPRGSLTPEWVTAAIGSDLPSKSELVIDFEAATDEFRAALSGWRLDDRVSDAWTLVDLIAHLTAWLEEGAARIPQLVAGAPSKDYDSDSFNAAAVERARAEAPQRVVERHSDAVAAFVDAVRRTSERRLGPDDGPGEWIRNAAVHYREHAAQLRERARSR